MMFEEKSPAGTGRAFESDENQATNTLSNSPLPKAEQDRLVRNYLPLARSVAAQMRCKYSRVLYGREAVGRKPDGSPLEDEFDQEATLGLIRAVQTYDPAMAEFSTYARHWIRDFIQQYIRGAGAVRRPKGKKIKLLPDESLNAHLYDADGEEDGECMDLVPAEDPDEDLYHVTELLDFVHELAKDALPPRQRKIFYDLASGRPAKEVAASYRISDQRVNQIKQAAIRKLREEARDRDGWIKRAKARGLKKRTSKRRIPALAELYATTPVRGARGAEHLAFGALAKFPDATQADRIAAWRLALDPDFAAKGAQASEVSVCVIGNPKLE
jgi:RNA polymerase sigma factor (sigma-70 family)